MCFLRCQLSYLLRFLVGCKRRASPKLVYSKAIWNGKEIVMTKKKSIAMLTFSLTNSLSKNKQIKDNQDIIPNYVNGYSDCAVSGAQNVRGPRNSQLFFILYVTSPPPPTVVPCILMSSKSFIYQLMLNRVALKEY